MQHIAQNGLQPQDVGVVPGAAGGPKGLILGPLDRFIFGDWLARSDHDVHLVGASIGAWRMATACLNNPVAGFEKLEHDYIRQDYALKPGEKFPSADTVSEDFGRNLASFYAGKVDGVLNHPRYKLHIITSRGRHILRKERKLATPLGYLGAFLSNGVARKAMGAWLERVVFSSQNAALPFDARDYKTRQIDLTKTNFNAALQASCSIPFVLRSVRDIPGAPPGAYWDGGITDYHLHLNYAHHFIAARARKTAATGLNDAYFEPKIASNANLVLYPHFQKAVVPGWLDKGLKWRHKPTGFLDRMVVLAPDADWVRTLPNGKLPDRNDFVRFADDPTTRIAAWGRATREAQRLADELAERLRHDDIGEVLPL